MQTMAVIKQTLNTMLGEIEIKSQDRIKEDLGLDSLSIVSLIVGLEDKLGIEFDESLLDPSKLITIADIINLVEQSL